MLKSLLLVFVTATVLTLYGGEVRSQTPLIPHYELEAINAACNERETVLHLLQRETEGKRQAVTKFLFCIDKPGKLVLRIECRRETHRCNDPVTTGESLQEFKRLLRSLGDGPPGTDV